MIRRPPSSTLVLVAAEMVLKFVWQTMTTALASALDAFYLEHRRCGELESGVDDNRVWMACTCGAVITRAPELADHD